MFSKLWNKKHTRFACIFAMGLIVALFTFAPYIYRFFSQGIVFSGSGDGYRQMMPFQMYLYEHFTKFKSFYDHSFGLGGDYVKGLSYYYATSPFTLINFIIIWLCDFVFKINPHQIEFWAYNQLIVSYFKAAITFVCAFYFFRYLKFKFNHTLVAAFLYAASTVVIHFNFTWSYYGDLLIFLPLSLLAIERFFKEKKIGLFIIAISLTLFSNFYFSYYEAIILMSYYIYRCLFPHPLDKVTIKQKLWIIPIAVILSTLVGIWGFYTGVSSFLANDRVSNPYFKIPLFTDFARQKHFFSYGFYITVSLLALIALLSFKLYKHYYYRLFAIATWIMLLGSLTPYFDSMFNGFSTPERRWIYIFALTTAGLIALFIRYLHEVTFKSFVTSSIVPLLIMITSLYFKQSLHITWMLICLILIVLIAILLKYRHLLHTKYSFWIIAILLVIQQAVILTNDHHNNVKSYESTLDAMSASKYKSPTLTKKINKINKNHQDDPLSRIDYMSKYGLNSPMLYHFNGISLYSSIFDGSILNYYDKTMQINMPIDKNSTYRLLSNRANLMALWNVNDRIRRPNDLNIPYGFKVQDTIYHSKNESFIHSTNQINYPSAHFTDKIYRNSELKAPIDKEHAMLNGVVFSDSNQKANSHITPSKNLLPETTHNLRNAYRSGHNKITVTENNGGMTYQFPKEISDKYQDMYLEMDVELLTPSKRHYVGVNEYAQQRNELDYKYRRFVTPVTMRFKADQDLKIRIPKGTYRLDVKGIYGEDYRTLKRAARSLDKVAVKQTRNGYTIRHNANKDGYVVLPIAYSQGMQAKSGSQALPVKKGNGIMTVIPVNKGQSTIKLTYTPPHTMLLIILSILGIILSIIFTKIVSKLK
ncbi:YfhO family protein [Staphylococcus gallinarum]|uniref:YfhO family protein n=1 Tax=Staphylococcus gallinarum TaxID=1293 RepID=UPI00211CC483|nr:YfhO family protein [Staphylococcus gallinarum]MCQ9287865.1 YfhO family protein [Staphylococcus gallinarum]